MIINLVLGATPTKFFTRTQSYISSFIEIGSGVSAHGGQNPLFSYTSTT